MPMSDVLQYRQQFYERWYDLRVVCERGETVHSVADKTIRALEQFDAGHAGSREYASMRGRNGNIPCGSCKVSGIVAQ